MNIAQKCVSELLNFIDESPSPWHATHSVKKQLLAHNFQELKETEPWILEKNERYYLIRDDSSIIAFIVGSKPLAETGYKIIGAHTDSPSLRIKPKSPHYEGGLLRLGVEIYGGPILATFSDRDLSLAGRISHKDNLGKVKTQLVHFKDALLRLPNLAIHMNSKVNAEGLKFHKQNELPLLLSCANEQLPQQRFYKLLESGTEINSQQILSWELNIYDTQKGSFWGENQEFYSNSQLDNLASCHAGLKAFLDDKVKQPESTLICAFFDHEEIGSETYKGANGSFLSDTLTRIALSFYQNQEDYQRALAMSFMISTDMAHAYQPNFPAAYEPNHKVMVNQGPVIKVNANQRYSSESVSEAMFMNWCQQEDVAYQQYAHRTDIPCGSTLGPMSAAKLGIRTVDVGNPMWAMHSIRESAGVYDHLNMIKVLRRFFED